MVKVKVCGIQRPEDALVAAEACADFIGLLFVPNRRRRVSNDQAQLVVNAVKDKHTSPPKMVGLFADQSIDEVNNTVARCGLDMVQLCGNESLKYCSGVSAPVIKVLHIPEGAQSQEAIDTLAGRMKSLAEQEHLVTLDRKVEGLQGGTGATFDWRIAAELSNCGHSFILAGGLKPDNVASAIQIARPWGVDVSSGVETEGVKDPEKIKRFIDEARLRGEA